MAQRKKSVKKQDDVLIDISEVTGHAEDFYEKYQKQILIAVAAIVVIVGGYLAYSNLITKPRQREAVEQMAQAEFQFERDSFTQALNNPGGGFPGFVDIIKKYGGTDAGNTFAQRFVAIRRAVAAVFIKAIVAQKMGRAKSCRRTTCCNYKFRRIVGQLLH